MKKIIASVVISDLKSSEKYLSIRGKLCDTKTNLNGVRVTEAFIDEIVANQSEYQCIPLCADVRGLLNNRKIGHMYNQATGEFMSSIIGAMQSFERIDADDGTVSLVFTARIMKRYTKVCNALAQLFSEGKLKFSFEVACGEYTTADDGTIIIDADPSNYLEGAAVVTLPACEEAVALELVAECLNERGETNMNGETEIMAVESEAVQTAENDQQTEVMAQTEDSEQEEQAETNEDAAKKEDPDGEKCAEQNDEADVQTAETENAEVYVDICHREEDHVNTYDTDTGVCTHESVEHTVCVSGPEGSLTSATAEETAAENAQSEVSASSDNTDCEDDKEKQCGSTETAEENAEHVQNESTLIAQILDKLEALSSRIGKIEALAESISQHEDASETVTAEEADETANSDMNETSTVTAEVPESKWTLVNPFVAEMSIPTKKYSLLEDKPARKTYTLL